MDSTYYFWLNPRVEPIKPPKNPPPKKPANPK